MTEPSLYTSYLLPPLFFLIAFVYAAIGLGGGTAYTSILAITGTPVIQIPPISQALNIIVSTSGGYQYARAGHLRLNLILPALLSSIPMAYFGASLHLPKEVFLFILWLTLLLVATRLLLLRDLSWRLSFARNTSVGIVFGVGAILGFIAGAVGIGGGIYLVPLLLILNLATAKEAAACGAAFVLVNSLVGLFSRVLHHEIDWNLVIPLGIAVAIGGSLGAYIGAHKLRAATLERMLVIIVLTALIAVTKKLWF